MCNYDYFLENEIGYRVLLNFYLIKAGFFAKKSKTEWFLMPDLSAQDLFIAMYDFCPCHRI